MIERLTKRTESGGVQFSNGEYWNTVYPQNENCLTDIHRMAIKLCDLEDKIEQGKIVELPCAVGDKVYRIWSVGKYGKSIAEFVVTNVSQIMENTWVIRYQKQAKSLYSTPTIYQCNFNDIGKTVFLDRASAEAKLREMEGDKNEQR